MSAPVLTEIEDVAKELAGSLGDSRPGRRALWQIDGPATSGKSVCLARIAAHLNAGTDLKPVLVAPPAHHLDAGAVALTDVAVGLASHGILNGELADWSDGVGKWSDRISAVQEWVSDNRDDVVLLCDAPKAWGANRADDDFFRDRGFAAAFGLVGLHCRRIVAGALPVPVEPQQRVELSKPQLDPAWLTHPRNWGSLGEAAVAVAESPLLHQSLTPLQVRLLVAAVALSSVSDVVGWFDENREADTRFLVQRVADLMQRREDRRLWDAWLRFSVTRRSFDWEVFERLIRRDASQRERDIAFHCLLFGERKLRMHDELKLCAIRWRRENQGERRVRELMNRANLTLFEVHRERFERFKEGGSPQAVGESMEAYHFASVLGRSELLAQVAPTFVDQLDALGWSLSYERRKYAAAAAAFEEALKWDCDDDYAHQYLAYNLDRLGERLEDVEAHFQQAVELNRTHPWWRSRLIMFLVSRGRIAEARAAWDDALLELGLGESDASVGTYKHLHCWVAASLANAGEPLFAREVLDAVSPWARSQIEIWDDLSQRVDALLQLGKGDAVVPGWRLQPGWWESEPALLQYRLGIGKERVKWLAGRVESKDEKGIHLRAAVVENNEGEPPITWTVIPNERFEEICRDRVRADELSVGSFIEIGLYVDPLKTKTRPDTIARVLPNRRWEGPAMSAAPVDRYLQEFALPQ
jgi:tetratricopeptide (TPR) repeat protein